MPTDAQQSERIFVGLSNSSGDVALLTILLQALKMQSPASRLTVATAKSNRVLLEHCPWCDDVRGLEIDGKTMLAPAEFHRLFPPAEYDRYLLPQITNCSDGTVLATHNILTAQFVLAGVPFPAAPQRVQLEVSPEDITAAEPYLRQLGDLSRVVLVNLRSYSIPPMYPRYEAALCAGLAMMGLQPYVVAGATERVPDGMPRIFPPYGAWLHLVRQVPALVGVRNGLCDISVSLCNHLVVAYGDRQRDAENVRTSRLSAMNLVGNTTEIDRYHPLPILQAVAVIYGVDPVRADAAYHAVARMTRLTDWYDTVRKAIARAKYRRKKG